MNVWLRQLVDGARSAQRSTNRPLTFKRKNCGMASAYYLSSVAAATKRGKGELRDKTILTISACDQQSPGLDRRSGLRYGSRVVVPAYLGVAQHRGRCFLIGRQRGPVFYG